MPFPMSRRVAFLMGGGAKGPVYLLKEEFTTAASAPITSPRTAEPGPGAFVVTDSGNKMSIASGALTTNGAANTYDPQYEASAGIALQAGMCAIFRAKQNGSFGRWVAYFNKVFAQAILVSGSNAVQTLGSAAMYSNLDTNYHSYYYISTAAGLLVVMDSTLIGLFPTASLPANCTPNISGYTNSAASAWSCDYIRVGVLGAPWNTFYGAVTQLNAAPADGATITQLADALVTFSWTAKTNETYELNVRRTDDDNRWIIRCSQAGSTIKIIERNAGTETERASTAQTFTNNTTYNIMVLMDTQLIAAFVNQVAKGTYASASFNQTATGVSVGGFTTGANLASWPRVISGSALAELQKWG